MGPTNMTTMTTTCLRDYDVDGMGACTEVEVGGVNVMTSNGDEDGSRMGPRKRRWDDASGGTSRRFEDDNDNDNDKDAAESSPPSPSP